MGKTKHDNMHDRRQVGLKFFDFLKKTNRDDINNKDELKDIYNRDFRNKNRKGEGLKDPAFSSVLYALKASDNVSIYSGKVHFNSKPPPYQDQWRPPRNQQRLSAQRAGSAIPRQPPSTDEQTTRVLLQRKQALRVIRQLKMNRPQMISDKNGVSITSDHVFESGRVLLGGVQGLLGLGGVYEHVLRLYIKNTGAQHVYFIYYSPLHFLDCYILEDACKVTPAKPLKLKPGDTYEIKVSFRSTWVGFYPATLYFRFKADLPAAKPFQIVRFLEARCVTSLGMELGPVAPYKPACTIACVMVADEKRDEKIVDGVRPERLSDLRLITVIHLKQYEVPAYMNSLVRKLKGPKSIRDADARDARVEVLKSPLSEENYRKKFQLMLYLEEIQMVVDIRKYNIPNDDNQYATMVRDRRDKRLLILKVPGVCENRPSVLRGDELLVCPKGEKGVKYRGFVHDVELDQLKLGFDKKLLDIFAEDMQFSVEFIPSRLIMRLYHRAVELMAKHKLGKVLFPTVSTSSHHDLQLPKLRLFDKQLEKNPEQYAAVKHIVAGSSKPAPYLLFGPPGTGKTVTIVEAIKQIQKTQGSCHILACAPCNSATDLLCKKIVQHVDKRNVYRMYARSWDPNAVPDYLRDCCNLEGGSFVIPSKEELMKYKIIVTTLLTAGRLVTGGIPPGYFTHVFVDEAGHAVEPECVIPLAGLLDADSGQVVLAGDPKQLGPILKSPLALKYGLGVSLLERLMNNTDVSLYQKNQEGKYNYRYVTKLLNNYRSHPAILKIPNELFYDGDLQACADEILRNSYCRWEYLPKKALSSQFPVIFHGVTGVDQREASSPSYFNVAEVELLMDYLKKLLQTQGKKGLSRITPKDIGIIAPYRKQVQKIRKALQKVEQNLRVENMHELKVGSVEEFQGQERMVILVSTVRSSRKYMEFDERFSLGFVKSEKRFNVAMTRAKALMIVVGNPVVLKTDPTWDRFIQYCKDEGGYTGFSDTDDEVEHRLAKLLQHMDIDNED